MQIPGALLYNQDVDILKELKSVTTDRLTIEMMLNVQLYARLFMAV